ncbi:MFS transporter [Gordonia sp. NPDC058843]|uniref:MFS transporter n=1 Tax=Gordonia sp. NPDC058843 TaxID=3346648 RepID=UPI0036CAB137
MLGELRAMSPAARLLVVNQTGVNLGFYMVLPFLASYLLDDLGMAAATVGLVLGARALSQQGLFLPSGIAVDRFGPWYSIVAGCALRVVAFAGLGLADDPVIVVAAVLLIGVAGALFNPAARTYLALESPDRRAEAFAVFEVFGNIGALLGPVLGALLLLADFQTSCLLAALVFAVLTIAQVLVLPRAGRTGEPTPVLVGLREVLADRRFGLLVVAMSAYLALFNQLYLTIPVEARRVTGNGGSIAVLFLVFSVLGIALQVRITRWCGRRWSPGTSVAVGLATMGVSFLPLLVSTALVPAASSDSTIVHASVQAIPVVLATIVFTVGGLMVVPYVVVLLSSRKGDRLLGTAYGWYYLVAAVATMIVAWLSGALIGVEGSLGRSLSFAMLLAVGLAGSAGVYVSSRGVPPRSPNHQTVDVPT